MKFEASLYASGIGPHSVAKHEGGLRRAVNADRLNNDDEETDSKPLAIPLSQ